MDLLEIDKRGAFEFFLALGDVDEKKGLFGVQEDLLLVCGVATLNHVVVEEHVWHSHQSFVHAVLSVEEGVWIACFN